MSEWFKAHGEIELSRRAKETATKLCDYILFIKTYQPKSEACRNAEIARSEHRSVCTRGDVKPNEYYGSLSARPLLIRNATLQVGTFRALMRTPAASLCRGSIAGIRASDSPVLEKPHNVGIMVPPLLAGGGASHPGRNLHKKQKGRATNE